MTKIYLDTEFIDTGRAIELVSIGLIDEVGKELYLINGNVNLRKLMGHDWLRKNVVPHLPIVEVQPEALAQWDRDHADFRLVVDRLEMRKRVLSFISARTNPELWAWYAAYDHVALCQLFGTMMGMPPAIPRFTNELRQEHIRLGEPVLPRQKGSHHHALADARWDRAVGQHLERLSRAKEIQIYQEGERYAERQD